jgi:hypothetical protein
MVDYKSTDSASPSVFIRQIPRMGYDVQAEFYLLPEEMKDTTFVFLAQEISAPYSCSLIALSNAYREVGRMKTMRAIALWQQCLESNRWPAYPTSICYAEPTAYQLADLDTHTGDW